jgi:hypothetical protein
MFSGVWRYRNDEDDRYQDIRQRQHAKRYIRVRDFNTSDMYAAQINAPQALIEARMYDDYKPSNAEWMDLLSIANTYGLRRVDRRAVAEIPPIESSWPSDSTSRSGSPLLTSRCAPVQTLSKHLKPRSSGSTLL